MPRLVDIIIPVYNGEQYVQDLIDCLNNQTMQDFCAIIVDDGSKDHTVAVLKEKLPQARFAYELIHQENKGLPGARNTGVRNAKAEWIVFMDSDDGLDPYYLEFLYRGVTQSGADVGHCFYQTISHSSEAKPVGSEDFSLQVITPEESLKNYYTRWFGAWVWILRRSWLEERELLFDEECTYLEDVPFNTQVIVHTGAVAVVNNPLYLYYTRQGSLMNTPKLEKYQIALDGFERMAQKIAQVQNPAAEEFRKMGHARYYLATLRKGAVLMGFEKFQELCKIVPMRKVRHQIGRLQKQQALAGWIYLVSDWLFYRLMRLISKN